MEATPPKQTGTKAHLWKRGRHTRRRGWVKGGVPRGRRVRNGQLARVRNGQLAGARHALDNEEDEVGPWDDDALEIGAEPEASARGVKVVGLAALGRPVLARRDEERRVEEQHTDAEANDAAHRADGNVLDEVCLELGPELVVHVAHLDGRVRAQVDGCDDEDERAHPQVREGAGDVPDEEGVQDGGEEEQAGEQQAPDGHQMREGEVHVANILLAIRLGHVGELVHVIDHLRVVLERRAQREREEDHERANAAAHDEDDYDYQVLNVGGDAEGGRRVAELDQRDRLGAVVVLEEEGRGKGNVLELRTEHQAIHQGAGDRDPDRAPDDTAWRGRHVVAVRLLLELFRLLRELSPARAKSSKAALRREIYLLSRAVDAGHDLGADHRYRCGLVVLAFPAGDNAFGRHRVLLHRRD